MGRKRFPCPKCCGSAGVDTPCCPVTLPATLHCNIAQTTLGVCSNIGPFDLDLVWDGVSVWYGELAIDAGCVWTVRLECVSTGSGYRMRTTVCLSTAAATPAVPCQDAGLGCMLAGGADYAEGGGFTCSPFALVDATTIAQSGANCCGCVQPPFGFGTWTLTITE